MRTCIEGSKQKCSRHCCKRAKGPRPPPLFECVETRWWLWCSSQVRESLDHTERFLFPPDTSVVPLERPRTRRSALNKIFADIFTEEVNALVVAENASMDILFFSPSSPLPGRLHVRFAVVPADCGVGTSGHVTVACSTARPCNVRQPP